ncbi:Putative tRNA/rRNA methyltransferase Rv0881, partial [Durusdinium trenchii]
MAFTLKYRNSFIDAEDRMPEGDDRMRRASSLPPRISKMVEVEEILEDEESLQCYVQKLSEDLSKSLDRSPLARCNRGSSPPERRSQSEEMEFGVMGQRLPGSVGHPELCRRPCIYFMAGNCENGDSCTYCHQPHYEKTVKLDKKQRSFMQSLSHIDFFSLIFHFCREKVEFLNITEEADEVLKILQEEVLVMPSGLDTHGWWSDRNGRSLRKTL